MMMTMISFAEINSKNDTEFKWWNLPPGKAGVLGASACYFRFVSNGTNEIGASLQLSPKNHFACGNGIPSCVCGRATANKRIKSFFTFASRNTPQMVGLFYSHFLDFTLATSLRGARILFGASVRRETNKWLICFKQNDKMYECVSFTSYAVQMRSHFRQFHLIQTMIFSSNQRQWCHGALTNDMMKIGVVRKLLCVCVRMWLIHRWKCHPHSKHEWKWLGYTVTYCTYNNLHIHTIHTHTHTRDTDTEWRTNLTTCNGANGLTKFNDRKM